MNVNPCRLRIIVLSACSYVAGLWIANIGDAKPFDLVNVEISNCAFNSVASILYQFRKEFTDQQLITALNLGDNLQTSASFQQITDLFQSFGLKSVGVADASPSDLLNAKADSIVQMLLGAQYHFAAVLHASNGRIFILDYPSRPIELTNKNCEAILRFRMTGKVLFVTDDVSNLPMTRSTSVSQEGHPLIQGGTANPAKVGEVNLNSKPDDVQRGSGLLIPKEVYTEEPSIFQKNITAIIPITNYSNREIAIFDPKGACSCFKGLQGPDKIKANSSIDYQVSFDKATLMNSGETAIAFRSDDEDLPVAEVRIKCSKRKSPPLFCMPVTVNCGVASIRSINHQQFIYSIYVPIDEKITLQASIQSIVPPVLSAEVGAPHDVWIAGTEFMRTDIICRPKISSVGVVAANILVSTNDPGDNKITLALNGYVNE